MTIFRTYRIIGDQKGKEKNHRLDHIGQISGDNMNINSRGMGLTKKKLDSKHASTTKRHPPQKSQKSSGKGIEYGF